MTMINNNCDRNLVESKKTCQRIESDVGKKKGDLSMKTDEWDEDE